MSGSAFISRGSMVAKSSSARGFSTRVQREGSARGLNPKVQHEGSARGFAATQLDRLIHDHVRLGIVSALAANETLSFTELKAALGASDGNLSVHAREARGGRLPGNLKGLCGPDAAHGVQAHRRGAPRAREIPRPHGSHNQGHAPVQHVGSARGFNTGVQHGRQMAEREGFGLDTPSPVNDFRPSYADRTARNDRTFR